MVLPRGETLFDAFELAELTVSAGETVGFVGIDAPAPDHTVAASEDRISVEAAYFAGGDVASERAARDEYASEVAKSTTEFPINRYSR